MFSWQCGLCCLSFSVLGFSFVVGGDSWGLGFGMVAVSRGMVWFSFSFIVCTGGMVVDGFRQDGWDVGLMWVISFVGCG